jgi:hypothetical protein
MPKGFVQPIYLATLAGTSATALREGTRGKGLHEVLDYVGGFGCHAGEKCDGFPAIPSSPAEGS